MDLGFLRVRGGEEGIELIPTVKLLCILLTKGERPLKKVLLDDFELFFRKSKFGMILSHFVEKTPFLVIMGHFGQKSRF